MTARQQNLIIAAIAALALVASSTRPSAGPSRFGFSDRVERHMFPEVTTGPVDPVWSPDGKWIAFSMQGDIWKVPAEGGEAIALTEGPAYHFEPAWSRDGRSDRAHARRRRQSGCRRGVRGRLAGHATDNRAGGRCRARLER